MGLELLLLIAEKTIQIDLVKETIKARKAIYKKYCKKKMCLIHLASMQKKYYQKANNLSSSILSFSDLLLIRQKNKQTKLLLLFNIV